MSRRLSRELDFGSQEKAVRFIEETSPETFPVELERRLSKLRPDGIDPLLIGAALASVRSVNFAGTSRTPHGLLTLASARALASTAASPEVARAAVGHVLRLVNREIHDPGFGPHRLLHFDEVAGEGKEGTLFSFLEAVRAGETDWADHRFAWLVRNLEKEQIVDLLFSAGLEGVTGGSHKITSVVEVVSLLQGIGWEWAPLWLRPVVRHQAGGPSDLAEYDLCRDLTAQRDLLRLARRRSPGQPALGEGEPDAFLQRAVHWAESDPGARAAQVADALADGISLEDVADLVALGATLLFLQETLRQKEIAPEAADLDRRVHLLTGVLALRQLVRLGTPGQRILGLLLAGWVPPARGVRLEPRSPDCGWWLPPASHLHEPPSSPNREAEAADFADWRSLMDAGQPNGILPLLAAGLERGESMAGLEKDVAALAPTLEEVAPGLAIKLGHSLVEAYRGARTPHRWLHLWAAAVALSVWPRQKESGGLRGSDPPTTIQPRGAIV
jgi:hypothetical protein